ncbi:hypothetical protein [Segniliparus rugosus]|uniref:Capsid maturation protease n=1 Tax=Segniliparus rugosus (strain ATCC BAA-974 / DSM 45345 / CCUG 50838 / CIP 108380 / JCM 13579 / CDC 945) TaxID=679197 RepID=E5XRT5_SEGRC|nr:hypothetical protein [Segniliparus rugosus]EFV12950.1 hypothetical protein HMPREF9336_02207 [Segniliparus rugosus ATCC BAA-974]
MTPDEYAAQQAAISAATAYYVRSFGSFSRGPALSYGEWMQLMYLLYPEVSRQRERAALLAQRFYNAQRALHKPDLPEYNREPDGSSFVQFVKNMEDSRRGMSQKDSPDNEVTRLALNAVREVENAGRRQIIHAVREDPHLGVVRGWARVATGRETCAWCLMLISRGPEHSYADTAGLDLSDYEALEMIAAGEDVSEYMDKWHPGCDCKAVPVFDHKAWPGKEEADRAADLWGKAEKAARRLREEEPDRVHTTGKNKGKPFTLNEDVVNALRRMLAAGDADMSDYAALAA